MTGDGRQWTRGRVQVTAAGGFGAGIVAAVAIAVTSPAPATQVAAQPPADLAFGEYLAGECVTCHRKDGANQGIPSIVGWEPGHFVAVMHAYREKQRDNPVMQTIAGRYGEAEIQALAAYFATLKPQ